MPSKKNKSAGDLTEKMVAAGSKNFEKDSVNYDIIRMPDRKK